MIKLISILALTFAAGTAAHAAEAPARAADRPSRETLAEKPSASVTPSLTEFEKMEKYREILRIEQVEGDRALALKTARKLLTQVSQDEPLAKELQETVVRLDEQGSKDDFEKAIKFLTGTKSEVYCRGVGLVEMTGRHNDGSTSRLALLHSNRQLKENSYSKMVSGDWIIELSNTYRPAISSDVFVSGSDSSYKMTERRQRANHDWDRGTYSAKWSKGDFSASYNTNGKVLEPAPMYMASDFHLWGNSDLGFLVTFKLGHEGHSQNHDKAAGRGVDLKSTRKVSEQHPVYTYADSKGETHTYKDCFRVDYTIKLGNVED